MSQETTNAILKALTRLVIVFVGVFISAWVLMVIWDWFVVPVLGVPSLSLPAAIGLRYVVNFFLIPTYNFEEAVLKARNKKKELTFSELCTKDVSALILMPLSLLFCSWVVTFFI